MKIFEVSEGVCNMYAPGASVDVSGAPEPWRSVMPLRLNMVQGPSAEAEASGTLLLGREKKPSGYTVLMSTPLTV